MSIVVGVDAGGSSTRALAAHDGVEGVVALEAGSNLRRNGAAIAAATIARAVARALEGAHADALHVGISGGGAQSDRRALAIELEAHFPRTKVSVSDDVSIALRAGVPQGDGIVLVAGTGSIAFASVAGSHYRAGGYGYLIGDEGSATAIGAAALNLVMRALDGRTPREPMIDRIVAHLCPGEGAAVLDAVYSTNDPVRAIAELAPFVLSAATDGERGSTKIVQQAALGLFELVRAVIRAGKLEGVDLPVVLSGGVLQANSLLTFLLETRLTNEFPHLAIVKGASLPVYGALMLARNSTS